MHIKKCFFYSLLLLAACLQQRSLAFADGDPFAEPKPTEASSTSSGSMAQFDKRLPPVMPGEMIGTGANRMKVWSTSGSVSAEPPPAPASAGNSNAGIPQGLGGVVVDGRQYVPQGSVTGSTTGNTTSAPGAPSR